MSIQRMTDLIILVNNNLLISTVLDEQMTVAYSYHNITSGYDNNNDERQLMSELISQGI